MAPESLVLNPQFLWALFRQFMDVVRSQSIKETTEYCLGLLLQELGFIRKMLDDKKVVRDLWRELRQPGLMEVFVFLAFTYFHGQRPRGNR
jgi:hypothetical protein